MPQQPVSAQAPTPSKTLGPVRQAPPEASRSTVEDRHSRHYPCDPSRPFMLIEHHGDNAMRPNATMKLSHQIPSTPRGVFSFGARTRIVHPARFRRGHQRQAVQAQQPDETKQQAGGAGLRTGRELQPPRIPLALARSTIASDPPQSLQATSAL